MDEPASGERIIAHLAFARAVAARSLDPRCRGADREDLIAWGVVGLVDAGCKMQPLSAKERWGVADRILTAEWHGEARS
jgi:DNA-directed RNA polymerase specialized sigma subunit